MKFEKSFDTTKTLEQLSGGSGGYRRKLNTRKGRKAKYSKRRRNKYRF